MDRGSLLCLLLCMLLGGAAVASAQQLDLAAPISQSQMRGAAITDGDDAQRRLMIAANAQRQAEIKRDSERMAELTQELNTYLQRASTSVLPVDMIKKAERIEKLAKSVRSKMKQSY